MASEAAHLDPEANCWSKAARSFSPAASFFSDLCKYCTTKPVVVSQDSALFCKKVLSHEHPSLEHVLEYVVKHQVRSGPQAYLHILALSASWIGFKFEDAWTARTTPTHKPSHPACYRELGLWRCDEKIEIPHVRAQTLSTLPVLQLERISARFCEALVQTSPMRSSSRNNTCLLTWRIGSQEHECGSQWNLERQYWWSRCLFCCSHCKKGFGHLRTTIYDPLQQLSR